MATRVCESCGAEQDESERFCTVCRAYLWWDAPEQATTDSLGGTTHIAVIPAPPQESATYAADASEHAADPPPSADTSAEPTTEDADGPGRATANGRHAEPPEVELHTPEVTLDADSTATVLLEVTNPSSIVDGYDILLPDAPAWLVATAEDAHLMPGEGRQIAVSLHGQSDEMILAQRLVVKISVVSRADSALQTGIDVGVVVPPAGPRMTMTAKPAIVRLVDAHAGEFVLVLDNHASNHPQSIDLSASDPEDQVRVAFDRHRLTVRPGAIEQLIVAFSSPAPAQGTEVTRQLTVVGGHPDGDITTLISLVLKTSPALVDAPLRIELSPSQVSSINGGAAEFEIELDNRGAHVTRTVMLDASDPRNRLTFEFSPRQVVIEPGTVGTSHGRVRTPPPDPGTSISIPFTITASDGQTETEAVGQLDAAATPDPMSTAALHVQPQQLRLGGDRRGTLRLIVDNRRGIEPLRAHLSGASDDGTIRLRFDQSDLQVPPQATVSVNVRFQAPRPPARATLTRQITFQATDGRQAISADAEVTQTTPDVRPIWSRVLVSFGALFVIVGALTAWEGNEAGWLPNLDQLMHADQLFGNLAGENLRILIEGAARLLVIVLGISMAFGMTGKAGGLTRRSAVLIILITVGGLIARIAQGDGFQGPAMGIFLVWLGAILGYIGGVLARAAAGRS